LREAIQFARQTLEMAAEGDALLHSYGHLGLAHAYRELGDYARSLSAYEKGVPLARAAGNLASANIAAFYLSRVLELQGHLHRAAKVLQEAIQYTQSKGLGGSPAPAILHFGLANLLCEWNDMPQAQAHLQRGQELARLGGHHELQRNGAIVVARLRLVSGDASGALSAIEEAQQATATAEMPLASAELAAHQARAQLALGDLAAAARWAEEATSRLGQDRGYTRHIEATTLARVQLSRGKLEPALNQLAACQRMAEESGASGWAIEVGLLSALAHEARGDPDGALVHLERALLGAQPEGQHQVFVVEGEPMAALLRRALARGITPRYVARLLKAFGPAAPLPFPLVESLSEREMEVLRLMAAGLSNREIAAELVLALGTVKAHLHNIYGKLGVQSRVQAAARARELHLL
jgi:LuxR family maltose regulon positive regulatory protein